MHDRPGAVVSIWSSAIDSGDVGEGGTGCEVCDSSWFASPLGFSNAVPPVSVYDEAEMVRVVGETSHLVPGTECVIHGKLRISIR